MRSPDIPRQSGPSMPAGASRQVRDALRPTVPAPRDDAAPARDTREAETGILGQLRTERAHD